MSSEFYSLVAYGLAITTQIFMYCWFGNEIEVKVSLYSLLVYFFNRFVGVEQQNSLRDF